MISQPRILIMEDQLATLEDLRELFAYPPNDWRNRYGIDGFEVETARTQQSARRALKDASETRTQFDVVLFDLGLPVSETNSIGGDDPQPGIKLLNNYAEGSCHSVVVATAHSNRDILEQLISPLVDGFTPKDSWDPQREIVFAAVAKAFFEGQRRLWMDATQLREQQRLRVQARNDTADRMLECVRLALQETLDGIDEVSGMLRDRFDFRIERDADDPLCRKLRDLSRQITNSVDTTASERQTIGSGSGGLTRFSFDDCVQSVLGRLRPGIYSHRLHPEFSVAEKCEVRSFRGDIEFVLEEAIFGMIATSRPHSALQIDVSTDGATVTTSVANDYPYEETPEDTPGVEEPRRQKFDRDLGLTLAQRLLRNLPGASLAFSAEANS